MPRLFRSPVSQSESQIYSLSIKPFIQLIIKLWVVFISNLLIIQQYTLFYSIFDNAKSIPWLAIFPHLKCPLIPQQIHPPMQPIHTVRESEINFIADHITNLLKNDSHVKSKLPLTYSNIAEEIQDGLILCKLINQVSPNTIPLESVNLGSSLNVFQKTQNLNLAIDSAKSIGCTIVNVHAGSILEGKHHIIMGLLWQITKASLLKGIDINVVPEISSLLKLEESREIRLKPEDILVRWLNYHIDLDSNLREVKNLGKDLVDGEAYGHVFSHIAPSFDKNYWEFSKQERSASLMKCCSDLNIKPYASKEDILSGDSWINLLFCCQIFNRKHGLKLKSQFKPIAEPIETSQSRQIRVYKNWLNSMNLQNVSIQWLLDDLKDGKVLLKAIDNMKPGAVDWKQVSNKQGRIMIVQNCNYVITLLKNTMKLNLINIGGVDIVDGKTILVLGLLSQLCKYYWLNRVGDISEQELLRWANNRVSIEYQIKSFKDPSLSNCMFLLKLIESIEPRVVNYDNLRKSEWKQDKIANIKYTISAARKIGAEIMLLYDHILESDGKFVSTMVAQLCYRAKKLKK